MLQEKENVAAGSGFKATWRSSPGSGTHEAPIKFRRKRREAMFN
jgi:hypothetical protein